LAEEVARICGREVRIEYRELPQDDPVRRQPDIDRARRWLGWEPTVQLREGLERTIAHFRSRRVGSRKTAATPLVPLPKGADS
jgi:UDP-glucuronate decarboxylase